MTMTTKNLFSICLVGAALAGCTSMNVFRDDSPSASKPPAGIEESMPESQPVVEPTSVSAVEIKKALTDKSWRWQAPTISGVTLYISDGSSLVEVEGKGRTKGKWIAKNGELCESMEPNPAFLPKGKALYCNRVTKVAGGYMVGPAKFTLSN
jgi:glucose/arabinose dehydrogenase